MAAGATGRWTVKPKMSSKATRLLSTYKRAVEDLSWKGSYHPDDWAYVERDYRKHRDALTKYIIALEAHYVARRAAKKT